MPAVLRLMNETFLANPRHFSSPFFARGNRYVEKMKRYFVLLYLIGGMRAYLIQRKIMNAGDSDIFAGTSTVKEKYREMRGEIGREGVNVSALTNYSGDVICLSGDATAARPSADYMEISGIISGLAYPLVNGVPQIPPPSDSLKDLKRICSLYPLATYVECVCINGASPIVVGCSASDNTDDHVTVLSRWRAVIEKAPAGNVVSFGADGAPPQLLAHVCMAQFHAPSPFVSRFEKKYLDVPPVSFSGMKVGDLKDLLNRCGVQCIQKKRASVMSCLNSCWKSHGESLCNESGIPRGCWFGSASVPFWTDSGVVPVQCPVHQSVKMRMRLKSGDMQIGNVTMRWDDLKDLCSDPEGSSRRRYRFLRAVDVMGTNTMNFEACKRMTNSDILEAAKNGGDRFRGMYFYLSIMKMVRDATEGVLNKEKIVIAWELVFILRFWRQSVLGSLAKDFLTRNVYVGLELNAYSFSVLGREGHFVQMSYLSSQSCERLFGSLRSQTTLLSDSVTFSMSEFHVRDRKRQLMEELLLEFGVQPGAKLQQSESLPFKAFNDEEIVSFMEDALTRALVFLKEINCGLSLPADIHTLQVRSGVVPRPFLVPLFCIPFCGNSCGNSVIDSALEEEVDGDPSVPDVDAVGVDAAEVIDSDDAEPIVPVFDDDEDCDVVPSGDVHGLIDGDDANVSENSCSICKKQHPPGLCRFVLDEGKRVVRKAFVVKREIDGSSYYLDRSRAKRVAGGKLIDSSFGKDAGAIVIRNGLEIYVGCYVLGISAEFKGKWPQELPFQSVFLGKVCDGV